MMMPVTIDLDKFYAQLDERIKEVWSKTDTKAHLNNLSVALKGIAKEAIEIGDTALEALSGTMDKDDILWHYWLNYQWPIHLKNFLILWRNILFEHQKAAILQLENQLSEKDFQQLRTQSKTVIENARQDLGQFWEKDQSFIKKEKNGTKKQLERWQSQLNPWKNYQEQIQKLAAQGEDLWSDYQHLVDTQQQFANIRQLINTNVNQCKNEVAQIKLEARKTIDFIEENIEEKPSRIANYLKELKDNSDNELSPHSFKNKLDSHLRELTEKKSIPIRTHGGLLQTKEVSFQKEVRQWLESESLPVLYEIWELTKEISNGSKMSLLNIKNRAILLTNETREKEQNTTASTDLKQPLEAFLKKAADWEDQMKAFKTIIEERLNKDFKITSIYHFKEEFLPVSLESTIGQFKLDQNEWLASLKKWMKKRWVFVQRFRQTVEKEEALSLSEKVVRYVQSRTAPQQTNQYSSIFLTKGFIGESFWVGRAKELSHIGKLVQQWKLGYRGAVILSGQRFSGKSLFGDLIANRHFANNTLFVTPKNQLNIDGRKFLCEHDLKAALDFIIKYAQNKQALIWIDDLELWSSPSISLSQNVRMLQKYIDNYAGKLFFMVSMGNWLKAHLQKTHDINNTFQAEINLDQMTLSEIREAVRIRHGATHKTLVNKLNEEVSPQQIQRFTTKIYNNSNGNIGEALNEWSYSIRKLDEERVVFALNNRFPLPDFLNPDTAILLATIMTEKRTNEFRLSKLFGPPFRERFNSILQRLISMGLLQRQLDGWLEINAGAANDIGRLLEKKDYLKFH